MKEKNDKKTSLQFEEMDDVKEFSLGGIGTAAMVVTCIAIVTQIFM